MKTRYGFSLVEIMIGLTLGIILSIAVIGVYLAQKNTYRTNMSQAVIQNTESAIAALVTPTIRMAGFSGCSNVIDALSNLNAGGPPPLGTLSTTPSFIMGYGLNAGSTVTVTQTNAPNSDNAANWTPSLDPSLVGNVEDTSDVLVVFGGSSGSAPIGVTTFTPGGTSVILQNTTGVAAGQFAGISDCAKASVFQVTSVAGNTVAHASGGGVLSNASDALVVNYPIGAQFITMTQRAFFVAYDIGGQSSLMRATLNPTGTWTIQALAPGVDTMRVLYGIGSNGITQQYVEASAVTDWGLVYAVKLGFLIEGQLGSATLPPTSYTVLGSTINVPADNRLRHVYEITINLRNAS
jgi:type IV pilus assembly protein PilW